MYQPRVKGATTGGRKVTKHKPASGSKKKVTEARGRRRRKVSENETVDRQTTLEDTVTSSSKKRASKDVTKSQPATLSVLTESRDCRGSRKRRRDSKTEELVSDNNETKQRSRRRAREVKVTDSAMTKWKPVSQSARDVLHNAMISALGSVSCSLQSCFIFNLLLFIDNV